MTDTMRAVVNYGSEPRSTELREVAVPEIGETDVLIAVEAVGVCGSDVHQYRGSHSWPVNYPVILGHEFGGTIVRTGKRVKTFNEGELVVSETAASIDLDSPFSRSGRYNLDPHRLGFGYGIDGGMAEFVRVPERCLHRVPDGVPVEWVALTEPCCVAYTAVCVNSRIQAGDTVVVIGPGPIGLLCTLMAGLSGAGPLAVVGIEADGERLDSARQLGATATLVASNGVGEELLAIGDGYGADLVIDAAGVSSTLELALQIVRPGGQITKVGWGPQPVDFSLDLAVAKNVTLQGSFSHTWMTWNRVLSMMGRGQLRLDGFLDRVAPLAEWQSCFDGMHDRTIGKAALKP